LIKRAFFISFVFLGIGIQTACAQSLPPIRRLPEPTPTPQPLEPKQNPLEVPPTSPIPGDVEVPPLTLKSLNFVGNTVFSSQELEGLTSQFIGRRLTISDVTKIRNLIADHYTKDGYINSGAAILAADNPNLNLEAADLNVRVIEGKLSDITINGSNRLSQYVRDRLKQPGVFNVNTLNKDLLLLQDDELISQIKGNLEQTEPQLINLAKLTVDLKSAKPYRVSLVADNYRNPGVGTFERGVDFVALNPLTLGDKLSFGYRNTNGSDFINAIYQVPITRQGTTIRFSYLNGDNSTIERPFENFGLQNTAQAYSLSIRHPILRMATERHRSETGLSFSLDHLESQDQLLGFDFPLSRGADDSGQTKITSLRFSQDWRYQDENQAAYLRSQLSLGVNIDSTTASDFDDGQFLAWRGDAFWARKLPGRLNVIAKAGLQVSDRPLVSSEQISLGGFDTIRGYRQDGVLGDNGFFGTLELRIPMIEGKYGRLSFSPFFDVGIPWDNMRKSESALLASAGLSLQYDFSDRLSANFTWGIPLFDVTGERKSLQEQGLLFSLKWRVL
jgi:hemolysin activation/secretion protein